MNDRDAIAVCNFANSNANEKNKGTFDNEVLIDISGLRDSFGLSILSTNDGSQNPFEFTVGSDTNDDNNEIGIGNFPLVFICNLTKYLGFAPQNNYDDKCCYFNLQEGYFQSYSSQHKLVDIELSIAWVYCGKITKNSMVSSLR